MHVEREVSELSVGFRTLESGFRDTSRKLDKLAELFTAQQSQRPAAWDKVLAVVNTGGHLFAMIVIGILYLASTNGAADRASVNERMLAKASIEDVAVLKWRVQTLEESIKLQRVASSGSNTAR